MLYTLTMHPAVDLFFNPALRADAAVRALHPRTSWRASREFRLQLSHELLKRAMTQAIANAGGNADV